MRIAATRKFDIANGPGVRSTMFVSGCSHNCKGCFNQEYKDFAYGTPFSDEELESFMQYVRDSNVVGVTILGGEPFDQDTDLLELVKTIKRQTNKSIWIYSGYTYEILKTRSLPTEILKYCDVLVDGPFVESKKDYKLRFRGSSNQRIIDIKKTSETGEIVLYNF